jgi:hypothetical protein
MIAIGIDAEVILGRLLVTVGMPGVTNTSQFSGMSPVPPSCSCPIALDDTRAPHKPLAYIQVVPK